MYQINRLDGYWVEIIKIRYSTGPKFRKYVKGYNFLSFARKFGDKKNCFKKSSSKTAEATGDLIGNKIADKITSLGKTKSKEKKKKSKKYTYHQRTDSKSLMT